MISILYIIFTIIILYLMIKLSRTFGVLRDFKISFLICILYFLLVMFYFHISDSNYDYFHEYIGLNRYPEKKEILFIFSTIISGIYAFMGMYFILFNKK